MERSGNFYKAIRLGYILISILIGCMAYNSLYEWQEIEALELGNKKIDELRKEINNINIQMIKFSLLGETILEWNDKDIEHYHARRMAMDSMLCRFKATYPAERIDSVRSLLEDKERQMFQIVRLMDEQQSINKKIANQIPVIVQKSVQEQSKKPKRKGFLGIFGKKKEVTPAVSTTILHSVNRNVISEQKVQDRQLSEQADSLAARNAELNRQLQELICQIEEKVQRTFHPLMQFGVELALLRTPPPPLGGREEQVASCQDEKRDDALTVPLRLMQYICCGNKNLAIYKYASNPSAKIRNCCSSEDWHISKKDRRGHRSTP